MVFLLFATSKPHPSGFLDDQHVRHGVTQLLIGINRQLFISHQIIQNLRHVGNIRRSLLELLAAQSSTAQSLHHEFELGAVEDDGAFWEFLFVIEQHPLDLLEIDWIVLVRDKDPMINQAHTIVSIGGDNHDCGAVALA